MATYQESGDFEAGIQYAGAHYARKVAEAVGYDMRMKCPIDTGQLWQSISIETVGETVYVSVGGNGAYWWLFVEYGTRYMDAQPFIRPSLNRRRNVVELGGTVF